MQKSPPLPFQLKLIFSNGKGKEENTNVLVAQPIKIDLNKTSFLSKETIQSKVDTYLRVQKDSIKILELKPEPGISGLEKTAPSGEPVFFDRSN